MRLLACALAVQLVACSVFALDTPPRSTSGRAPPCDTELTLPGLDLLGFGATFIGTLITTIGLSVEFLGCCDRLTRTEALGLTAASAVSAAYGLSGMWGRHQVHRCRRLHGLPPLVEDP